ncbi:MAG: RNA polymerase sigma factor [Flavobacteriales bacterium]
MEQQKELKSIVEACLRGERRAQERLFQTYYGKMLGVCMRYLSDRDSAQEILQISFLKVFDKLEFFDFTGSLEGWIRRIVTNTAIDHLRKAKKNPFLSDQDNDFVAQSADPMVEAEHTDLVELKGQVAIEAIGKLSPAYRAVFNLYVIEDHTHKEIAEILGISEGTSKSNLAKAKMNLQRLLKEQFTLIEKQ